MSPGLNRRDRIAVLVLGILLLFLLLADRWIGRSNPTPYLESKAKPDSNYFESPSNFAKTPKNRRSSYFRPKYGKNESPYPNNWQGSSKDHQIKSFQNTTKQKQILIELNSADSSSLIPLPGIGPALASRIVKYRNKLGGFYSVEQIKETYGITDSVFSLIATMITIKDSSWQQIHINTITLDELKMHPYFKWQLANTIVNYRKAHGPFTSIDELNKIALINEETLKKFLPYIQID